MSVHSGAAPEQERVLNVLQMYENGALCEPGTSPKSMRVLPLLCKTVLDIRNLNRKLIDKLDVRSWKGFDVIRPRIGDEILVRIEDASGVHVELMEWTEEDIEFFDTDSGDVRWMKLPPID